MGLMRFVVSDRDRIADGALDRVYMCGLEEVPWRSRAFWDDRHLVLERRIDDSGNVFVPWRTDAEGELTLGTASLMERDRPYRLEVELARGAINSLRNQIAAWESAGLTVPTSVRSRLAEATQHFAAAATLQNDDAAAAAEAQVAIELAVAVGLELGTTYTEQAIAVRRGNSTGLTSLLGVNLGTQPVSPRAAKQLADKFNAAVVPLGWRQIEVGEGRRAWETADALIEWCLQHKLKPCSGPLIQFDAGGFPDWTYLWEGDFDNLLALVLDHVRAVVGRYQGKMHLWQIAGRVNSGQALSLSEEDRLRMVVHIIETIRSIDARTPLVVGFDQPWGEYLARANLDLSPIHFADTLVRAHLGIAGIALEMNVGFHPLGSLPRGMLEVSRLLDRWSLLGLPLLINVTTPSRCDPDPLAELKTDPLPDCASGGLSPAAQAEWVSRFVPLLLSKNCVQVVVWNQLSDAHRHDFPHGGLVDAAGRAKPGLAALQAVAENFLA